MNASANELDRRELMQGLHRIPPFPPVALRVLDVLAREAVEFQDLEEIISADAAFSAQILRVANSPLFGITSRLDSLRQALTMLGLERVQTISLGIATSNYVRAVLKVDELRRCWRHSLAVGLLAQEIARATQVSPEHAYTVGLLHDIGRLGLLVAFPDAYAECLRNADRNAWELLDYERRQFGVDHCEAGTILAELWNLPDDVRLVAGRHHDVQEGQSDVLAISAWACRLADVLGFYVIAPLQPVSFEEFKAALPAAARERLDAGPDRLRNLVETRLALLDAEFTPKPAPPPPAVPTAAPPPPEPAAGPLFASIAQQSTLRRFREDMAVAGLTALIMTITVLAVFYLVGR